MLFGPLYVDLISDLYIYDSLPPGFAMFTGGKITTNDEPIHSYRWDINSLAVDDGYTVIKPNTISVETPGRWLRTKSYPVAPVMVTFTGTTNPSGNYSITYSTPFTSTPNVIALIVGGSNTQFVKLTSSTTTGFTVQVMNRNDVLGLLPTYSAVNGAIVNVLVTQNI